MAATQAQNCVLRMFTVPPRVFTRVYRVITRDYRVATYVYACLPCVYPCLPCHRVCLRISMLPRSQSRTHTLHALHSGCTNTRKLVSKVSNILPVSNIGVKHTAGGNGKPFLLAGMGKFPAGGNGTQCQQPAPGLAEGRRRRHGKRKSTYLPRSTQIPREALLRRLRRIHLRLSIHLEGSRS